MGRGFFCGRGRGEGVVSHFPNSKRFLTLKYIILFGFKAALAVAIAIVLRIYVFDGIYHFYKAKKNDLPWLLKLLQ